LYTESEHTRKKELARKISMEDGIGQGLVCVMGVTEGCLSFRI